MLISHICRFIYLKTLKTAGTSVEIYFEPYCVDPRFYGGEEHARKGAVSGWGVVGARRLVSSSETWYNHMPAIEVRKHLGLGQWNSYFKFCVIRNPYDKMVSYFWHGLDAETRDRLRHTDFSAVRQIFTDWTKSGRLPIDAQIYTLEGLPAVDDFIRYERLTEDVKRVCSKLNIPWQPARFGRYKSDTRKRPEAYAEYYTPEALAQAEQAFAWEFDYFGYPRLPGAPTP
jgi:hypothetical protein